MAVWLETFANELEADWQHEEHLREMRQTQFWQTKTRGTNEDEYQIYLACADDGNGLDITTGKPLKTYEQWLAS